MKVGTKLAAILLAPLVVLAVLAGLGISERAGRASDLRAAERDAAAAIAVSDLQFALEVEQMWGLARLTGNSGQSVRNFQEAADGTDQAVLALQEAIANLEDTTVDINDRIAAVGDRLTAVTSLRADVTSGEASTVDVLFRYEQVGNALLALVGASVQNQVVPDIGDDLGYAVTLSNGRAADAVGSALVLALNSLDRSNPTAAVDAEANELKVRLDDAQAEAERYYAQFFAEADGEFRSLLRNSQSSSAAQLNDSFRQQVLNGDLLDPAAVAGSAIAELADNHELTGEIDEHTAEEAAEERSAATRTAQLYLLGAGLGILLAVALAFVVARSITRPLRRLTHAAERISTEQLPALVSQLQAGSAESVTPEPIELNSRDEIGQLAVAFNTLQQVTVDVAQEQGALLRKGIGDIFVNLARRNQALLDRQIEFIDQLEANERDPDQLENLFRLDHLATRMRRNAESLLVLAGAETARRRGRPVALADVVRVAVGEVADYSRLRVRTLDEARVSAAVAVDLAHLLAELMENATQFSPPTTSVEVQGGLDAQGQYVITVTDRGIGIQGPLLAEYNELLAKPPLMGLELSRSLGFVVIGRLAQRHGIVVQLHAAPIHGVAAAVRLPSSALAGAGSGADQGRPESRRGQLASPDATADTSPFAADPFGEAVTEGDPDVVTPGGLRGRVAGSALLGSDLPNRAGNDASATNGSNGAGVGFSNGAGRVRRVSSPAVSPESFTYYEVAEELDPQGDAGDGSPLGRALPRRPPAEPAVQPVQPPPPLGMGPTAAADFTETERDASPERASAFPPLVLPTPAPHVPAPAAPTPDLGSPVDPAPVAAAPSSSPAPFLSPGPSSVAPGGPTEEHEPLGVPVRSMFSSASMAAATPAPPLAPPSSVAQPDIGAGSDPGEELPLSPLPSRRPGRQPFEADEPGAAAPTERMRDLFSDAEDAEEAEAAFTRGLTSAQAPDATSSGGLLASGLPSRRPGPAAPAGEPPVGLPLRPAAASASLSPANTGDGLTAAGLVRRSPKQQLRAMARGEPVANTRVMATQRSPEEVRKMLSRYRSGLQRGRTPGLDGTDGPQQPEGMPEATTGLAQRGGPSTPGSGGPTVEHTTEHATEESPWRN
ncbi:MAG: HAMP domain-containing protein [Acidimicrobiales bacterium]